MDLRVSVLLPVRNAADTVGTALDSILTQTLDALEVVVVDDGSSDRTPSILAAAARSDSRVRVVTTPPRGLVPALERARLEARAPLLARMDADDRARPDRLAHQIAALDAHPEWAVCGGHVRIVPRGRLTRGRRRYEAWLNGLTTAAEVERDLFVECPLAHPTWTCRAEALAAVGGYRDEGWAEDHDLLLRLRAAGWRLGVVPEVVLEWTDRPGRLSRSHPAYALDAFVRCRVHHLPLLHPRSREGVAICGSGPVGKAFSRAARAAGLPLRAFVDVDPRKVGQEIHGVPVLSPDRLPEVEGAFLLSAVAGAAGRSSVRAMLSERGLVEGRDFVAVA